MTLFIKVHFPKTLTHISGLDPRGIVYGGRLLKAEGREYERGLNLPLNGGGRGDLTRFLFKNLWL